MTELQRYDAEGKERAVSIARYVNDHTLTTEDVGEAVRENVQQDTYLMEKYGEEKSVRIVGEFL